MAHVDKSVVSSLRPQTPPRAPSIASNSFISAASAATPTVCDVPACYASCFPVRSVRAAAILKLLLLYSSGMTIVVAAAAAAAEVAADGT